MSSKLTHTAFIVLAVAASLTASTTAFAAGSTVKTSAVEARDTKTNPDRWKKGEDATDATDDKAPKHHDKDKDDAAGAKPPQHHGELNGKLDLGSW